MPVLFKKTPAIKAYLAGDHTMLKEILHPKNDGAELPYSVAFAHLEIGKSSLPHRLKSTEVYFFLSGNGKLHVGGQIFEVEKGDLLLVPPGASQFLENTGNTILEFLCIVSPPWALVDEEVLK